MCKYSNIHNVPMKITGRNSSKRPTNSHIVSRIMLNGKFFTKEVSGTKQLFFHMTTCGLLIRPIMVSLICAWINGWVNNRETGDLRRHRAHYDVIVMKKFARESRPIQYVELDHQSGSRKQHCWKFWNPIERIVMPRYVFLYFLMAFAFFLKSRLG